MDVSGETADLVVKESIQATESAVKLAGTGLKNVAALLLALSKEDYKVVGKTSSRRLARDPSPAEVVRVKQEDMGKFQKLAMELGILYFFARKKGSQGEYVNVVSTQNYAAQLNAALEALGYPIPARTQEETPKKANPRAPQEKSLRERGIGSTPSPTEDVEQQKPSVKKRLERLKALSEQTRTGPEKVRERTR